MTAAERPSTKRLVCGKGVAAKGALMAMAITVYDYARLRGFGRAKIDTSRVRSSASHYVSFHDGKGRRWIIRISDHFRPRRARHDVPHLDIVSRDGIAGAAQACAYVDGILAGQRPWFDPAEAAAAGPRRR